MAKGELQNPMIHDPSITRMYGRTMRVRREEAGQRQRDAAEALGISQATLSRFEAGDAQPDYKTLERMAGVYGCKTSAIAPRNQYPSAPLDPVARREYVVRRNAAIQHVDPDETWESIKAGADARAEREKSA